MSKILKNLTKNQQERYKRNIIMDGFGEESQEKLLSSSVLVIGAGGLGSPALLYLASSGIGKLGIVDFDKVDLSNLQRQVIHNESSINTPKAISATNTLAKLNSEIELKTYDMEINSETILPLIREYDFIIEATDNFAAKFLINDACVLANKPFTHAGILAYSGQTMTIVPHKTACFACIFDKPPHNPPTGSTAGILATVAGTLGLLEATEAIKYLSGIGTLNTDAMLHFDAKKMDFRKIKFQKNPNCRVCGENGIKELRDYE